MASILNNRFTHLFLLLIVLMSMLMIGAKDNPISERLRFATFDKYNEIKPRPSSGQVMIIDIDDDSLAELGQWPWPRNILADMLYRLDDLGARVVAFDGVLAEPDRSSPSRMVNAIKSIDDIDLSKTDWPDYDAMLAKAIDETEFFVGGFTFGSYKNQDNKPRIVQGIKAKTPVKNVFIENAVTFKKASVFLPQLEQNMHGNGSFMAVPEFDGIMRRAGLVFSDKQTLYPSLSLEALRVGFKNPNLFTVLKKGESDNPFLASLYKIELGPLSVETESDGKIWIYYRPYSFEEDYISAYKILDDSYEQEAREKLSGKIVYIASSAEGLKDLRNTSLQAFRPGVEIHANVTEQILQDKHLVRTEEVRGAELIFIASIGLFMIILAGFTNAFIVALLCFGSIAGITTVSWLAFSKYGFLIDPTYPSIAIFLLFVLSTILSYIRTEAERRKVREAFGLYISKDFMKELTDNPDSLQLGGEVRELSVMFTDVRNFTSITERLSPAETIQLMNDFLTPMSDEVMKTRGTIDKYMGDAMMAFWNAPLDDTDHARHACLAALRMNRALDPINDRLAELAEARGHEALVLKAGIGVNTGPASVGNMGSRQRFAYSALGDSVNLASRLEGQTKFYDVSVIIGEDTKAHVPEMAALELDLIKVKGRRRPVRIYALVGDEEYKKHDFYLEWEAAHNNMITLYQEGDFKAAAKAADKCLEKSEGRLVNYYYLMKDRIDDMLKNTPEKWDGVYVAKSK